MAEYRNVKVILRSGVILDDSMKLEKINALINEFKDSSNDKIHFDGEREYAVINAADIACIRSYK